MIASFPIPGCPGKKVIRVFVYGCGHKANNTNGGKVAEI